MKKSIGLTLIILSALLFSACAAFQSAPAQNSSEPMIASTAMSAAPIPAMAPASGEAVSKDLGTPADTTDRIVIKNANLSIAVLDPATAMQSVIAMTESMGGYVVSTNSYKTTSDSGVIRL